MTALQADFSPTHSPIAQLRRAWATSAGNTVPSDPEGTARERISPNDLPIYHCCSRSKDLLQLGRGVLMSPWRLVTYSASMVALSTFGTGYFIGLFNPYAAEAFGISQSTLSLIFSVSTMAAVVPMYFLGRLIDVLSLRLYTGMLILGFAAASALLGWSPSIVAYAIGIFLVRLIGDWLFPHAALTTAARSFGTDRARLAGLTAIGYAIGPATLPASVLLLTGEFGWRTAWYVICAVMVLLVLPAMHVLLLPAHEATNSAVPRKTAPSGSRLVLDRRILAFLPSLMTSPLILTGLMFHQSVWSVNWGGTAEWLSLGLIALAFAQSTTMLLAGLLVEKVGLVRMLILMALPGAIGLIFPVLYHEPWTLVAYLAGSGATIGFALTLTPLLLVAVYGPHRLGSARAVTQSLTLLCTACSTIAIGLWMDRGQPIDPFLWGGILYVALSSILIAFAGRLTSVAAASMVNTSTLENTENKE